VGTELAPRLVADQEAVERIERAVADVGRAMSRRWWRMSPERAANILAAALGDAIMRRALPVDVARAAYRSLSGPRGQA